MDVYTGIYTQKRRRPRLRKIVYHGLTVSSATASCLLLQHCIISSGDRVAAPTNPNYPFRVSRVGA
eukprot:6119717-Pyramimonas_sp.AAC.1